MPPSTRTPIIQTGAPIVLDTNLWIDAARNAAAGRALNEFVAVRGHRVVMLSVVAQELAAGARTVRGLRDLQATLAPFEEAGRTIAVSYAAEREAGRVLAALSAAEGIDLGRLNAGFLNDVRIATACREYRALLVTRNAGDFAAVQRHLAAFRFVAPWP